jgi:hypothetical protein
MESIYEANEFAISLAIFALMVIASERDSVLGVNRANRQYQTQSHST